MARRCLQCGTSFAGPDWTCPACGSVPAGPPGLPAFAMALSNTLSGFDPAYFDRLVQLEHGSFWFRARNALILWALARYFPGASTMLEIGCGTGYVLSGIAAARPGLELWGSELHLDGLAWTARRLPAAKFLQMDARAMPFDGEFDLMGAFDVIEHIEQDEVVLREAHRTLAPGGGLLITVPQHPFLWSAADEYAYHQRRYTAPELRRKVQDAGFRIVLCTSFVSLLMPLLLVSRLANRSADRFDPEAEYRMSGFTGRLLSGVMRIERALIETGVRFPFGGSLLLAAERI